MRAGLTALLVLTAPAALADDLFSPGPLSRAHQELEGLSNCRQCHGDGDQIPQGKCLQCHQELQPQLAKGDGFHGRLEGDRSCQRCHHEHQGRTFALVEWIPSKKQFPHARTGWPLTGAHQGGDCEGCHQRRLIFSPEVQALLRKQPKRDTFLGLSTRCAACHFDEHRGQLNNRCDSCHETDRWAPAPMFDHGKTDYPLTGRHRRVRCAGCHEAEQDGTTPANAFPAPKEKRFLRFAEVAHASCTDCHQDPHDNRFGARCQSCHTTAGWQNVKTPGGSQTFHEKTRFPLRGEHEDVACRACHGPFPGRKAKFKGLPFERCSSCHVDAHLGQLREGRVAKACESCHSVDGFTPPRFELTDHQKTAFPLAGAHQAVPCSACHPSDAKLAQQLPPAKQRRLARMGQVVQLSLTRFELGNRFESCPSCHRDVHAGQFDARIKDGGCESCHSVEAFAPAKFDHRKDSRFPLEGKHAQTACASCHVAEKFGRDTAVRYRPMETSCQGCHADPHGGQFEGGRCEQCHGTDAFSPALFRHQPPFTRFLLDGRHAAAKCEACHARVEVGRGKTVVRYTALPTTCEGCHQDFHQGEFRGFTP